MLSFIWNLYVLAFSSVVLFVPGIQKVLSSVCCLSHNREEKNVLEWNHESRPLIANMERLSGILEKIIQELRLSRGHLHGKGGAKPDQKLSKYLPRPLIIPTLTKERFCKACHCDHEEVWAQMIHG